MVAKEGRGGHGAVCRGGAFSPHREGGQGFRSPHRAVSSLHHQRARTDRRRAWEVDSCSRGGARGQTRRYTANQHSVPA
uniref:Uncharacterized protein n=1 Tax=Anguilla anguilla TaxID=7936 RepID=A0A0E9W0T3_ANGAN